MLCHFRNPPYRGYLRQLIPVQVLDVCGFEMEGLLMERDTCDFAVTI